MASKWIGKKAQVRASHVLTIKREEEGMCEYGGCLMGSEVQREKRGVQCCAKVFRGVMLSLAEILIDSVCLSVIVCDCV